MKNKKDLAVILMMIVLTIIIVSIICIIININKNETEENTNIIRNNIIENTQKEENNILKVYSVNEYYTVVNCLQDYLKTIYELQIGIEYSEIGLTDPEPKSQDEIKDSIYKLLDNEYIQKNNITVQNVLNYVDIVKEIPTFKVDKMRVVHGEKTYTYIVYGSYNNELKYYFVTIDNINSTYCIEPLNEKYNDIDKIKVNKKIETIEKNTENNVMQSKLNEQAICRYYLMDYKSKLRSDINVAYTLLNKDYKEKRFSNIEYFKEYLEDNKETIDKITLNKYAVEERNGYTEYVCQDKLGNTYIFQAKAAMEYDVQLDSYTSYYMFTEKYAKESTEKKIAINIEKIIQMINSKDYRSLYNSLDEEFKAKNFTTYEKFKEYIKNNFFEQNEATFQKGEQVGNIYVYRVTVKDASQKVEKQVKKDIIIQLKEETDFVMSFNI